MNQRLLERVCEEYSPDKDYDGDYGHYLAEQIMEHKKIEELEKRAELDNEIEFINMTKKSKININNEFTDRYKKEELIKRYTTYKKLNGFESLASCPDYAIGSAFKNVYNSALKKIKEYGEGK
ncbi:MAG: hypothetical protein AABX44_01490 [Nanoarchaeota archaeon]